jgi:hypothetical protein
MNMKIFTLGGEAYINLNQVDKAMESVNYLNGQSEFLRASYLTLRISLLHNQAQDALANYDVMLKHAEVSEDCFALCLGAAGRIGESFQYNAAALECFKKLTNHFPLREADINIKLLNCISLQLLDPQLFDQHAKPFIGEVVQVRLFVCRCS